MTSALGNRPTAEQLLVLHAALDEREAARTAWERWRGAVDFDDVDHGSTRLLPLVYRNLGPDSFDAEVAGRLKGLYRRSWSQNQLLFKRVAEAIAALERAGIETLVTKGASLAVLSYGDVGVRPMDDADVLVPIGKTAEAIEALGRAGWLPDRDDPLAWTQVHHSLGFAGPAAATWTCTGLPSGSRLATMRSGRLGADGAGRGGDPRAQPRRPVAARLRPRHAVESLPPFRWIADAVTVIRSAGEGSIGTGRRRGRTAAAHHRRRGRARLSA